MGEEDYRIENSRQAIELMELICISGEFPADAVYRLSGGRHYKDKLLINLRNEKLIHTHYRDKLLGHRLNQKAKKMLLERNHNRFDFFITENVKSEITRRQRLHRVANALVTMYNSGVKIFKDEKPDAFNSQNIHKIAFDSPGYYISREFKSINADMLKVKNARAVGILMTSEETVMVYNTENYDMKWDCQSEIDMRAIIKTFLSAKYGLNRKISGLLLGNSMEILLTALSDSREKNGNKKREHFFLDNIFTDFIFLTNDRYGEILLKLLYDRQLRKALDDMVCHGLKPPDRQAGIENDAFTEDGKPVLNSYLINMPKLARFCSVLERQKQTGVIICFDFQEDVLSEYCGKKIEFDIIEFDKFKKGFIDDES